nr:hypothetical protein [Actinomycetota bacterium]
GRMIAQDTGHRYIDEAEFAVYDKTAWRDILRQAGVVVQCPHMLRAILDDPPPGIFVVLMRRDLGAIHASARRIEWETRFNGNTLELGAFGRTEGDSAQIKYEYWDSSPKPAQYLELDYECLRGHPLYVAKESREHFGRKQTNLP